ncbi:E3 ubiquitin-protein ligase RHA2B-like [Coffea eugenioides]|uniref:E3 ubiquitin-protein ligase RHA2B-like n=1 Tax=Coffea arabica TaxID=13443 RepID=A0ABM4V562_COFAR|nr:E3 ubiquitin-protein ligase RHA2B-like [Coffea eugenioides]
MGALSQFLAHLYTIVTVLFTILILELVILVRSITGNIQESKKKTITTKQYLKLIEEKIPARRYKKTRFIMDDSIECAVCLSLFEEGEFVRKLKCKHIFHKDCLDRWLQQDWATCPLCRTTVLPEEIMMKYRQFLHRQEYEGSDEDLIFLISALHGNYLRRFL